ncbi:MAG: ABC transporter substrate-binding protein [Oligoflexales bacterium]
MKTVLKLFYVMILCAPLSAHAKTTLRIGVDSIASDLEGQTSGQNNYVRNLIAPPFLAVSKEGKWVCIVCTEIPSLANGRAVITTEKKTSFLQTDWEIKSGFFWEDGKPVSNKEVAATIETLKESSLPLNIIERIKVDPRNPRKFSVTFKTTRPDFFKVLAISLMRHKPDEAVSERPDANYWAYGRYKVKSLEGHRLFLERNTFNKDTPAKIDELELIAMESSRELVEALERKQIDIVKENVLHVSDVRSTDSWPTHQGKREFVLSSAPSNRLLTLAFNLRNPQLMDHSIRDAIALAVDRQAVNDKIFAGLGEPSDTFLRQYDDGTVLVPSRAKADLAKAAAILDEAGWKLIEGKRQKQDKTLEAELAFRESTSADIAKLVGDQLEKLGMAVTLKPASKSAFKNEVIHESRFKEMALVTWHTIPFDSLWSTFHSSQAPGHSTDNDTNNIMHWQSKDADGNLEDLAHEWDPMIRKKHQITLVDIVTKERPIIPLVFEPNFALLSPGINGYSLAKGHYETSLFANEWSIGPVATTSESPATRTR